MKVAQLLPELNFGGVERGTVDLANFLVSQGHALIISAGGVLEGELDTKVKSLQIPISKKSLSALMQFKALKKILLEERPDIVHVRSRFPAWIYLWLQEECQIIKTCLVSPFMVFTASHGIANQWPKVIQLLVFLIL